MTSTPLASVVMAVHNGAAYIAEAIESVHAQTVGPLELIVVDDGSTDASGEIAAGMGARLIRQENAGAGAARNAGVAVSGGRYLSFIDADDVWMAERLEAQIDVLEADTTADMCFAWEAPFVSPELDEEAKARLGPAPAPRPAMIAGSMVIALDSFRRAGAFRVSHEGGEYLDWLLRARRTGLTWSMLERPLLRRRIHGANMTLRAGRENLLDYVKVLREDLRLRREEADA